MSASTSSSASVPSTWSLKNLRGEVLWTGDVKSGAPKAAQLLSIVNNSYLSSDGSAKGIEEDKLVSYLAAQIVQLAPLKAIPILLSLLSCVHNPKNDSSNPQQETIDASYLSKSGSGTQTKLICGAMFKKGDLVWTCQTCGKDPTCVQCDACFRAADHAGHEVYFHRSMGAGGCCDCGDAEAWAASGNCSRHGCKHRSSDTLTVNETEYDPLTMVPLNILRDISAVLKGVMGLMVSYSTAVVRGFDRYDVNPYVKWPSIVGDRHMKIIGKLHNDDIHTFDEVTGALVGLGLDTTVAQKLTQEVDSKGECVLPIDEAQLRSVSANLSDRRGLLFSLLPECVSIQDARVVTALQWMHGVSTINDGLQRIVGTVLMTDVVDLLPESSCVRELHGFLPSSLADSLSPNLVFRHKETFPSVMQHLPSIAVPAVPHVFDNPKQFSQPFDTCPRLSFAVLIMASPYYSKAYKKAMNNIIIVLQKDWIFKSSFSQLLTILYPAIYALYLKYVGSDEGSLLETSVQVYTANSIVRMLSSAGIASRVLPESCPVHVSRMLVDCLRSCLYFLGATVKHVSSTFLDNPAIVKNRFNHLFRDLDYVFENPLQAVHVLRGERDPGTVIPCCSAFDD
jgi:hypothetical protein